MKEAVTVQEQMNTYFRQPLAPLLTNAERDVRLARAEGDRAATARAQARLETLRAALGISVAAHLHAHGTRSWSQEVAR